MPKIDRFEDLEVWKTARELTRCIYDLSDQGSFSRDYGLRDQLRRAAVSVMSNIAEGFESRTQSLFIEFLGRAKGSAGEVRSQLYIVEDRKYLGQEDIHRLFDLAESCSKQLAKFIHYLVSRPNALRIREGDASYDV